MRLRVASTAIEWGFAPVVIIVAASVSPSTTVIEEGAVPYYRLYNSTSLRHHWTSDANEYYTLIQYLDWNGENIDSFILPSSATGSTPSHRLHYPQIPGLHHWTIDANEYSTLVSTYGWIDEGAKDFLIR